MLSSPGAKYLAEFMASFELLYVVEPTRQRDSDTPHTLDLVLTSEDFFLSDIEHLSPLGMSDHCVLKFDCHLQIDKVHFSGKFKYNKGDYEGLQNYMNIDWDSYLDVQNGTVDDMWEKFKFALMQGMNRFIPKGSKCRGKYKKNFQPFNKELQQLINTKHKLWKRWLSSRDDEILKTYKATRNKVKKETKNLIIQDQHRVSLDCKRNPKRFWQFVNRKTSTKTEIGDLHWKDPDGITTVVESDLGKAEALQDFFSSVYTREPDGELDKLPSRVSDKVINTTTRCITEEDIYKKLNKLKVDKSPSLNMLHPRVLYETKDEIISAVYNLQ